jgi:hypothetical protein
MEKLPIFRDFYFVDRGSGLAPVVGCNWLQNKKSKQVW